MHWWNIKLPDDSPEWREHQLVVREDTKQIHDLGNVLRVASGKAPKQFQPVSDLSESYVRFLRDRFESERKRPKPTRAEIEAHWQRVREQAEASARFRANS